MSLTITGNLLIKGETQQVTDKFSKREFVIQIDETINGSTYTNYAKFQCVQNKCSILDPLNIGDEVEVSFNVKGNKWEKDGKVNYMTNLDAWKVEVKSKAVQHTPAAAQTAPQTADDLPF